MNSKVLISIATALILVVASFAQPQKATALTINLVRLPGDPGGCDRGSGNLDDIVQAAATRWEKSIRDKHTLTLYYGWAPVGGGEHALLEQGGSPNRETLGQILFNNNCVPGNFHWFLDPNPKRNQEYLSFTSVPLDLGAGPVEVARFFGDPTGDAAVVPFVDLKQGVEHEMGHALGISLGNTSFVNAIEQDAAGNFYIAITEPRPFAGTKIPLATNIFGVTSHIAPLIGGVGNTLMASVNPLARDCPSAIDILVNAEISQFDELDLTACKGTGRQEQYAQTTALAGIEQAVPETSPVLLDGDDR